MNLSISNSKKKRSISTILIFLAILLLSDRLLFFLTTTTESNIFTDLAFKDEFKEYMKNTQVNTVILGTSRTYEGIHPPYFEEILGEKAFKEAQSGKGPKYNYYFYKFYQNQVGIPDIVIYGVDYFTFNIESRNRWLSRFNYRTEADYFFPGMLLWEHKKKINEFIDTVIESLKTILQRKNGMPVPPELIKAQNYLGSNPKKKKIISKRPDHFKRFRYRKSPGIEGNYFIKLLDLLHRDGVTVLLVMLPDYYGTNLTNINKRIFIRDIRDLGGRYSNVQVYNYNTTKRFPLDRTEYFINGGYGLTNSHLSRKGAKLFNRILLNDIRHHYIKWKPNKFEPDPRDGQIHQKKIY